MRLSNILFLLFGLLTFLYGIKMLSNAMQTKTNDKINITINKFIDNKFKGILIGAGLTALVQSSSLITVMLITLVNAGTVSVKNTVGVIMGANIGTTVTGLIIALNNKMLAPILIFIAIMLTLIIKDENKRYIATAIGGISILFLGMNIMSISMRFLADSDIFINMILKANNPVIGILTGAIFTAIIQSSSASVGVLQALALSGLINLENSIYILLGFSIGTCITAIIASVKTNKNAKQVAYIHLLFNVFGAIIFAVLCNLLPVVSIIKNIFNINVSAQIAYTYLIYKIIATLCLFPFSNWLISLSNKMINSKKTSPL